MVEYAFLINMITFVVLMSVQVLGGTVTSMLSVDALAAATTENEEEVAAEKEVAAEEAGECPPGWILVPNNMAKKNGQNVDANGDGVICLKDIPGQGKGNTNANQNIKDNNGS